MASLLYPEGERCGEIGDSTLADLFLDRFVRCFCRDLTKQEIFLDVLSKPLLSQYAVRYRQSVLRDFMAHPQLAADLCGLFDRFTEIRHTFEDYRKENVRFFRHSETSGNVQGVYNLLKMVALTLKRELLLVKAIAEMLSGYEVHSDGLTALLSDLRTICAPDEYEELLQICTYFETISVTEPFELQIHIGKNGKLEECRTARYTAFALEHKKGRFAKKEQAASATWVPFHGQTGTTMDALLTLPIKDLISLLEDIAGQIFRAFRHYAEECLFYQAALSYCRFCAQKGCPLSDPEFSADHSEQFVGLRDLFLLAQAHRAEEVVPNDFSLSSQDNGVVIFGENGGGKTVYLRSVGCAQIFAQSGLPIPADSAKICCFSSVFTQFSKEENGADDSAGRFEQEVMKMAHILDRATENSLVLFNEPFQTTDYKEGAEALSDILKFLSSVKAKWVLVTHIHQIKPLLPHETVFMRVESNYHMRYE